MRRTKEIPGHMPMIMHLAPVILIGIKRPFFVFTYAPYCSSIEAHVLGSCQVTHWSFDLEVIDTFFLPFYELFEQSNNYIITGVNKPLIVEYRNIRNQKRRC